MEIIMFAPVLAAAGYSLIYLLMGGGLGGAILIFVVLKMLDYNSRTRQIETEHISLVLGPQYVISFQEEREGDPFNPVRARLTNSIGRTRRFGALGRTGTPKPARARRVPG